MPQGCSTSSQPPSCAQFCGLCNKTSDTSRQVSARPSSSSCNLRPSLNFAARSSAPRSAQYCATFSASCFAQQSSMLRTSGSRAYPCALRCTCAWSCTFPSFHTLMRWNKHLSSGGSCARTTCAAVPGGTCSMTEPCGWAIAQKSEIELRCCLEIVL